ncbi:class I poly(R)-hydroxyalkanoic acid synthase [Iodidimonas nitroreducens]|uniref:Class I poly(R)-hydroxyalkanoic acid synthase n=1 Tax=Iodidimonas nitroreducens TaxID=1236968 RepID=A0A5A7N581_9PROT|nr:class I poly(R)-hydroxyalkanoic acid synthase [Iodidimonas nitroreducens]GAK33027.1 poly-beta-hydroxybutyrate polymerase [alpha proteobacterium Q-1]GER03463.1 class I poly(R)-hydroxyalkanoic acid synthase [Iodidimonas nitroreducens]
MTQSDHAADKTPESPLTQADWQAYSDNMAKVATRTQELIQEWLKKQQGAQQDQDIDPLNIGESFFELTAKMMSDPARLAETQMAMFQDYLQLWQNATLRMMGAETEAVIAPEKGDKRFKHPEWSENQLFDFIKQSYLLASRHINKAVEETEGLDPEDERKTEFYTRQFIDALSPSNFALTNPEVLQTTVETRGENLIKGLENLLNDLERGSGDLSISMTDEKAFEVGRNVAVTPGKVVYECDLFQLIQYSPNTKEVYEKPLLIFPPWINKFYILDLTAQKSFVKWCVDQGITVFMVSWVNPDASLRDKTLDDYLKDGQLRALEMVEKITGVRGINVIGYCVAGTLLAATLAWLEARGEADRIASVTFFTAQVDFEDAGELKVFVDEDQLEALSRRMQKKGYLDASAMAGTFNMLRSNDLIWSFVVNNYLLGKEPFPFDLLYWNSDSTNLAAGVHAQYLRAMYYENALVKPGGLTLAGESIDLRRIKTPAYIQAGREDHIAPPQSVYKITGILAGPQRFVLAGSGHIAGVVNPPDAKKYQYWTKSGKLPKSLDEFTSKAIETPGSWWPDWLQWLEKYSGPKIPARDPGSDQFPPIEEAPGRYVKVKAQ